MGWLRRTPLEALELTFYTALVPGQAEKRTAIYARSSTDVRTADTQLDTCRQIAPGLSLTVVEEFVDHDVSGMVPFGSRAAARRLLGVIEERSIDAVLVYRADRLARSSEELAEVAELFDWHGLELWSVADHSSPTRIIPAHLPAIAAFAESERSALVSRMKSGAVRAAREGKWVRGPVPFGYDLDERGRLIPSPRIVAGMTEADLARSVFQRMAAGSSTIAEARRMNDLGVFPGRRYSHAVVKMKRGKWFPSRVNAMIRNEVYMGKHRFKSAAGVVERAVAVLVSQELWHAAQQGLRSNCSRPLGKPNREYLLRRLIECADCGAKCVGSSQGKRQYYACMNSSTAMETDPSKRCRMKHIPARPLDELILAECGRMSGLEVGQDFASRRMLVKAWVKRVVVRTIQHERPKVAHVFVDYVNGEQRTYRFTRGAGVAL
jgi:DNA invertase Pin-like site-specific DNA recombinase